MPARSYEEPRAFLARQGTWPVGPFAAGAPEYARVSAGIAAAVLRSMDEQRITQSRVASLAGLDKGSLSRLLAGRTVPDVATVAALERALDTDLWPGRA